MCIYGCIFFLQHSLDSNRIQNKFRLCTGVRMCIRVYMYRPRVFRCVYMFTCMNMYIHTYICINIYFFLSIYMYIDICIYTNVYIYVCIFMLLYNLYTYARIHICTYICIYIYMYVYTYIYTHKLCVCTYVYSCEYNKHPRTTATWTQMLRCVYLFVYLHMYIYLYIRICLYVYILVNTEFGRYTNTKCIHNIKSIPTYLNIYIHVHTNIYMYTMYTNFFHCRVSTGKCTNIYSLLDQ